MGRRVECLILVVVVLLGVCGASWGQNKASAPYPADGAMDVIQPLLQWTKGTTAVLHRVYLGTDPDLGPDDLVAPNHPMAMYWHIPGVVPGTTYYWRVDEIEGNMTTIHTGDVWTFTAQPLTAFHPDPPDGSTAAAVAPTLTWLPGQGIRKHQVYFSDNFADVNDAAAAADKGVLNEVLEFAPGDLVPLTTYYWRIDEIPAIGDVLPGPVWSFTTIRLIDDFESYTNEVGARVFQTWLDGLGYTEPVDTPGNGTGALVGYDPSVGDIMEKTVVHGGLQSMPFDYNNTIAPYYSEAERTWAAAQNWTAGGVDTLTLHVRSGGPDFVIPRVSTPPVLDGVVEEAWDAASVQYVSIPIDGEPDGPEDSSGSFRVLYDSQYLYLLVDVNDETLVQDSDPAQGWLDDRIEIFIDGDNSKDAAQDGTNDYQYCFRWNHGVVETPVEWYRSPGSLAGVGYAVATTDSGYRFEVKLSWSTMIGMAPQEGRLIGIDVMIGDDDDGGDRDTQISWHLPSGDPHVPSMWGTALLPMPATPGARDLLYVALQDSFNRTVVVAHPDPNVIEAKEWFAWTIPLAEFAEAGANVNLASIMKMYIGVGDRDDPKPGGTGLIFIDDVYLTKPAPDDE